MSNILPIFFRDLAIKGIFSDDDLFEILTLKGGNAMALLDITDRASQDLDFSIKQGIRLTQDEDAPKFKKALERTFEEEGYRVIDFKFDVKPKKTKRELPPFWGGYSINFKVMDEETYEKTYGVSDQKRSSMALQLEGGKKKIEIDISLEEYTEDRMQMKLDEYQIHIYSPLMIVYEKMRALCQQLPDYEYASFEKTRARDLYDIYIAIQKSSSLELREQILSPSNVHILREMFKAKNVSLELLLKIEYYREQLEDDFNQRVTPQIADRKNVPDFDFLFEFNIELIKEVYALLEEG
ncbi:nucleotidyl transferase AbiEii/AbiGii toxin family protein [Exiguobacterium sp. MER 193]|uniref:nucleotidyl transferase AbiEii/AbiGii toxin family protein n=1 Tax=Exiguobacterium sp. MER 193 TaxID=2939564 RepID=UPI0020421DBC|nr:nucleotidyl transferase AbiEii/AbiGii toxin family protein [Exiguobacterium sp. MER 193]MCM3281817.1 nucleotidyl transferase AbiEii/AbiGii toxin family protein [Exiguobacterium sp. MER 193]